MEGTTVIVKNAIPGQKIRFRIHKKGKTVVKDSCLKC